MRGCTDPRRVGRDLRGRVGREHDSVHAARPDGRTDSARAARGASHFRGTGLEPAAGYPQDQTMTNPTRPAPEASTAAPALIALDWGTTSLRAYLYDAHGALIDTRGRAAGVMHVPAGGARAFDAVFEDACGDWLDRAPGVPVLAAGMVGSAQGWREAPYVAVPAGADALVAGLVTVTTARGTTVSIVPGVIATGELPDVMRGEETQIFGALAGDATLDADSSGILIGLPGTHAKWAWVKGRPDRAVSDLS
ncbi:2-keto-3-deoxy-galactonokinase [Burkholderia dolosa AU0158]|nr:2-keto-3-deoxy-galactonokinase [Burkholderia dolosa AU0158]